MKYSIPSALLAAALAGPFPAFAAEGPVRAGVRAEATDPVGPVYLVTLDGMMCGECQKKVQGALEKIDGVDKVAADWQSGTVHVTMANAHGVLTLEQVQKALAEFKEFTLKDVKKA